MIEAISPSPIIAANLELLRSNRARMSDALAQLTEEERWSRPLSGKWAAGEHLVHLNRTLALFTRVLEIVTPVLYPFAWFRRERPYATTMTDWMQSSAYQPSKTAPMLEPRQNRRTIAQVSGDFEKNLQQAKNYFLSLDEPIAGHLLLPYPPTKGTISVLQLSFALGYHERHHFRLMGRLHGALLIPDISTPVASVGSAAT